MDRTELIKTATEFFKKNPIVTLVTLQDGFPSVRPVSGPIVHEGKLLISTGASSRKVAQIKSDPHVALHGLSEKDWTYCTVRGIGTLVTSRELREKYWKEELRQYFPKGIDDPEYCFVQLEIQGVDYVDYSGGFDKPIIHRATW